MDTQQGLMEAQDKESPRSHQGEDETDTDTPIYVVHLAVQRSEDVKIFEREAPRKLEDIKSETITEDEHVTHELAQAVDSERSGMIDPMNVKQEQLEEQIDIEYHGFPDIEHTKREIEEVDVKSEELASEEAINKELFAAVKQDSEPTEAPEGRSRDQYIPEKQNTVKEIEPPNTTTSTGVSASTETAAVMMEVSRNTSRCTDTATNRGNVSVDSDNEYTTAETDVGHSRGEHLTDDDCGDMFDDKHLVHVEHHDTDKIESIQNSCDGSAQECQGRCSSECDTRAHVSTQSSALNTHLKIQTKEKPFECTICQHRFTVKSSLNNHLRIHTKEKPFECTICQHRFTVKSSLNKHLRIHTKEKPFECTICQRRFTFKSTLNDHLRIHTKEQPYECSICQRRFTTKSTLNKHVRVHTNEKPFKCSICERMFSEKCILNIHLRTHTKEKPFECTICPRRFSHRSTLNRHLRTHTKEKPFECPTHSSLKRHSTIVHGVPSQGRTCESQILRSLLEHVIIID